jgi:hypothetical protein
MEHAKTLAQLNENSWYRLIKVIFLLALVVILIVFNLLIISYGVKQIDSSKTTISCSELSHLNNPSQTFTPDDINISLNLSDFQKGKVDIIDLNNEDVLTRIFNNCYSPTQAESDVQNIEDYKAGTYGGAIPLSPGFENVDIHPVFTYRPFLELFLIGNLIILLAFEAIRRIFYYITLGKISPQK